MGGGLVGELVHPLSALARDCMEMLGCGPVKYNLQQKHESRNDSMAFDCSLFERQQALFERECSAYNI